MSEKYTVMLLQNFIDELDKTARNLIDGEADDLAINVVMDIRAALIRAVSVKPESEPLTARQVIAKLLMIDETYRPHQAFRVTDNILAALAAAQAAPSKSDGWMPIETAPVETVVLTLWDGIDRPSGKPARYHQAAYLDPEDGEWKSEQYADHVDRPTHWMPLPPTPTESREGDAGGEQAFGKVQGMKRRRMVLTPSPQEEYDPEDIDWLRKTFVERSDALAQCRREVERLTKRASEDAALLHLSGNQVADLAQHASRTEVALRADNDALRAALEFPLGQLRHAYSHLIGGTVGSHEKFANGLISPAIKAIEAVLSPRTQSEEGKP